IKNFRTLQFIVSSFYIAVKQIKDFLNELDEEHKKGVVRSIFLNILVVSNEYKEGRFTNINHLDFAKYLSTPIFMNYLEPPPDQEYVDFFTKKYHNRSNYLD